MSTELDPRPTRSPVTETAPRAAGNTGAPTALRYMGLGFLLGFLLSASHLGRPDVASAPANPARHCTPPTANTGAITDSPAYAHTWPAASFRQRRRAQSRPDHTAGRRSRWRCFSQSGGTAARGGPGAGESGGESSSTARRFMSLCRNRRPAQTRQRPCQPSISLSPACRATCLQLPPHRVRATRRPQNWSTSTPLQPRSSHPCPALAPTKLPPSLPAAPTHRSKTWIESPVSVPAQSKSSHLWSQRTSFRFLALRGPRDRSH